MSGMMFTCVWSSPVNRGKASILAKLGKLTSLTRFVACLLLLLEEEGVTVNVEKMYPLEFLVFVIFSCLLYFSLHIDQDAKLLY